MGGEEARRQLHKNVASNIEQVLAATPHKAPTHNFMKKKKKSVVLYKSAFL